MVLPLSTCVRVYASMVESIDRFEDESEVVGALAWRDAVHERIAKGESLTADDSEVLARADASLRKKARPVVRRHPGAFPAADSVPAEMWWWRLPGETVAHTA